MSLNFRLLFVIFRVIRHPQLFVLDSQLTTWITGTFIYVENVDRQTNCESKGMLFKSVKRTVLRLKLTILKTMNNEVEYENIRTQSVWGLKQFIQKRLFLNKPIHITSKEHTRAHVRTQAVELRALSYDAPIGCVARTNKLIKAGKKLAPKTGTPESPHVGAHVGLFVCYWTRKSNPTHAHTRPKNITFQLPCSHAHEIRMSTLADSNSPTFTWFQFNKYECLLTDLRACVRVCVRACLLACVRACVLACVRVCAHVHAQFVNEVVQIIANNPKSCWACRSDIFIVQRASKWLKSVVNL